MQARIQRYLGDQDFWRTTLRLALPIAAQRLLTSSFSMVDTIMIGSLGSVSLAAVGMAGQWAFLLNVVFFGFCSGAAVFVAQCWGAKDFDQMYKAYGFALTGAMAASLLFTLAAALFPSFIIGIFTEDDVVIAEGAAYLRIAAFSYPFIALAQVSSTLLTSTEEVRLPMWASFFCVVVNVCLNALFMFKMGMGVRGAALATAIAALLNPALIFLFSAFRRNQLIVPLARVTGWSREFVAHYVRVSLPVLLNESLWAFGTMLYNALYGHLSTEFFAAVTIFRSVENMLYVFFVGLCHASSVVVGKQVGAGDTEAAERDAIRYTIVAPLVSVAVGLAMIALRGVILLPFDVSAESLSYAMAILLIYGLEFGLRNIPYITIVGVFRAGGDTKTGLKLDVLCVWLISLPLTWICGMALKLPLAAVFAVMLIAEDLPKSILCLRHLLDRRWIIPVTAESKAE